MGAWHDCQWIIYIHSCDDMINHNFHMNYGNCDENTIYLVLSYFVFIFEKEDSWAIKRLGNCKSVYSCFKWRPTLNFRLRSLTHLSSFVLENNSDQQSVLGITFGCAKSTRQHFFLNIQVSVCRLTVLVICYSGFSSIEIKNALFTLS